MKVQRGAVHEEFNRDLYWVKISFLSDDERKKTDILACSSWEYWHGVRRLPIGEKILDADLNIWREEVISKWMSFGEEIFNQGIHYDIYATTKEGEANGIDFLMRDVMR